MAPLQVFRCRGIDVVPELARRRAREQAAAHADAAVNTPAVDGKTRLGKCALPGKHVRVNGVHQSAIEIEDESAHHGGLLPTRFPGGLLRLPRPTGVCDYPLRLARV